MASFAQQPSPEPAGSPAAQPAPARPKIAYSSAHVDGKYIALTFDDGPHPKLTPKLLDLLAARHIKVTFFLIGENVKAHPELAKREIDEGHVVGNHSWSHPNLRKLSDDKVRSELQRTNDVIKDAIGVTPALMRPPYGELSAAQAVWVNREFGFRIIRWDVDPNDWKDPGPSVVAARILSATRPGSIILSHDIHAGTVAAMPFIIDSLLAKGYQFVTVPELLAMDKPHAKKGAEPVVAGEASPAMSPRSSAPASGPSPTP